MDHREDTAHQAERYTLLRRWIGSEGNGIGMRRQRIEGRRIEERGNGEGNRERSSKTQFTDRMVFREQVSVCVCWGGGVDTKKIAGRSVVRECNL